MLHGLTRSAFRRLAQADLPEIDSNEFAAYLALRWCDEGEPVGVYPETLAAMFAEFIGDDPEVWADLSFAVSETRPIVDALMEANDLLNENTLLGPPPGDAVRISHNFGLNAGKGEHLGMALSIIQAGLRPRPEDIGAHSENPFVVFGVAVSYPASREERYAPQMPWVLADVPREFSPFNLNDTRPGNVVTLPNIPVEYIVGVNGVPVEMFRAAYDRWGEAKTAAEMR